MMTFCRPSTLPLVRVASQRCLRHGGAALSVCGSVYLHQWQQWQRQQQQQQPMVVPSLPSFSIPSSLPFSTGFAFTAIDLSSVGLTPQFISSLPNKSVPVASTALVVRRDSTPTVPRESLLRTCQVLSRVAIVVVQAAVNKELREFVIQRQQDKAAFQIVHQEFLKIVRKAYRKRQFFTKFDKYALLDYTGPGFAVMNQALRSGTVPEEVKERVDAVEKALKKGKLPVAYNTTVYRGAKLPAAMQETLRPGATFSDPAFLSASLKKELSYASAKGNILFIITSKTGRKVQAYSSYKKEEEVLFWPNVTFKIQSVEDGVVTMEELF